MQALKVAQAGDTIALQSGTYAAVNLSNLKFAQDVVITSADPGKPAILTSMTVSESEGLTFRNLEFEVDPAADFYSFRVSGSKDIHFDELDVHGTLNGTPSGDITAFLIRDSEDVSITNSEFQQLFTGVSALSSKGLTFSNNEFHDIRSDGIQGGGNSNVVVTNNKFWDFFPEDGDHPDAIQFWTTKTTASAENYVISGNIISRGAGEAIQGIFLRDESGGKFPYLNVKITDNLLIGVSWNGITLNGRGGEIGGNTLISYADQASRVRLEFSEGINVHDNSAGGYVYLSNVNTQTTANGTTGAVSDAGASALAKWMSAHPGIVVGIGSSASPPVIEKPVPPITPPVEGGANPDAVVELCPCGTAFAFHNLPATDQFPSSDPLSSWQVRSKGKSVKALMGRGSSYAGDHVELADGRDDFASSVGIGAVISSKFTWPRDTENPTAPLPEGGYVLTPEKEVLWKKWVALYREHMLPLGDYRGELYDIGFDAPETHAIAKDGAMYYAFYAKDWNGTLELRGLGEGRYRVRDLFNGTDLGSVDAKANTLRAGFTRFLLLQATPEAAA